MMVLYEECPGREMLPCMFARETYKVINLHHLCCQSFPKSYAAFVMQDIALSSSRKPRIVSAVEAVTAAWHVEQDLGSV